MSKTPNTPKAKALAALSAPAHTPADKARMALMPSVNGASVIEAYQGNLMGKEADINVMIDGLNNGAAPAITHAEENQSQQSKLLEDKTHERPYLDIGATSAATRSNQAVEAVGKVNRAKKPRG